MCKWAVRFSDLWYRIASFVLDFLVFINMLDIWTRLRMLFGCFFHRIWLHCWTYRGGSMHLGRRGRSLGVLRGLHSGTLSDWCFYRWCFRGHAFPCLCLELPASWPVHERIPPLILGFHACWPYLSESRQSKSIFIRLICHHGPLFWVIVRLRLGFYYIYARNGALFGAYLAAYALIYLNRILSHIAAKVCFALIVFHIIVPWPCEVKRIDRARVTTYATLYA